MELLQSFTKPLTWCECIIFPGERDKCPWVKLLSYLTLVMLHLFFMYVNGFISAIIEYTKMILNPSIHSSIHIHFRLWCCLCPIYRVGCILQCICVLLVSLTLSYLILTYLAVQWGESSKGSQWVCSYCSHASLEHAAGYQSQGQFKVIVLMTFSDAFFLKETCIFWFKFHCNLFFRVQ